MKSYRRYPEYKDSGIEWLGEIPAQWEVKRLKFVAHIEAGQSPPSEVVTDGSDGLPFLQGNADFGLISPLPRQICDVAPKRASAGHILLSVRAPVGALNIADQEYGIGRGLCAIGFNRVIHQRFGFYTVVTTRKQLGSVATGSTYDAVTASDVGGLPQLLPPEPEQCAIADFLYHETAKIDALIEKKEQLIELLKEKRTALISHAVTKGLDPNVPMKDSGIEWLGQIPAHWKVAPLKRWIVARPGAIKTGPFGSQLLSSEMRHGTVQVYNQRTVLDKDFASTDNLISEEKYRSLASFTVYPGDLLVTTRGTIGRCAIVPNDAERGILHPCLLRIQPDPKQIVVEFLSLLIQDSFLVQIQLALASNATTIDVIYGQTIGQVIIPRPPIIEQHRIIAWVKEELEKLDHLISRVEEAIELLKEYRTALISAAVTGKIDVRNLAAKTEMATK